ncbi:hypothetical protein [Cetobacterium sp.]|uniref:hypothetical protein n=1 Tax=Cetobacterium sp. TaxID=2071632 RepID=UPI003EE646AF
MKPEFEKIKQSDSPLDKEVAKFIFSPNFKELMDKLKESKKKKLDDLKIALKESCLITCFSERFSDQKMWSGYAENFKGFCLEYNFENLLIDEIFEETLSEMYNKN